MTLDSYISFLFIDFSLLGFLGSFYSVGSSPMVPPLVFIYDQFCLNLLCALMEIHISSLSSNQRRLTVT